MVLRWGFTVVVYKIKKSYDGKGTWDSSIEGRREGVRQEKERNRRERVGEREGEGGRDKEGGIERDRGRERGRERGKRSIGREE